MGKKINFLLFVLVIFLASVIFGSDENFSFTEAQVIEVISAPEEKTWTLAEKIRESQKLLTDSAPLRFFERDKVTRLKNGRKKKTKELARKEISLAVLDTQTGEVFEKRYWLDQDDIKKANKIRKNYQENTENLPRFLPKEINEEFAVTTNWWNNHNSDLGIVSSSSAETDSGMYLVVANKFLMDNDQLAFPDEITGQRYSDIIYTPYSSALHTEELEKAGSSFISRAVEEVAVELNGLEVESKVHSGQLLTETIPSKFVKNILVTEQVDPGMIFASEDNGRKLSGRVFVRYAANGERAFRYTFSRTGAAGAGQIMPGTYRLAVKSQPDAKLIKDIDIGRVDLKNGIKATFVILDMKLSEIERKVKTSSKARTIWAKKTPEQKLEAVAAAYNGGSGKYNHLTGAISLRVRETVDFVKKYKMIRDLKLFE